MSGTSRRRHRRSGVLAALLVGLLAAACVPVAAPAPEPPTPPPPTALEAIAPPAGATPAPAGTSEWYWAPAPGGHAVTLGVYRPVTPLPNADTVLILNGADGFRRIYEDLAARIAAAGHVAVVGCWYEKPAAEQAGDAVACVHGPTFQGARAASVADLDALVAATLGVSGIDPARLVVLGHSYGAAVALLRASGGATEPVAGTSGLYAGDPPPAAPPLPTDVFAVDVASTIAVPVLIVHGEGDAIVPVGQADALVAALTAAGHAPTFSRLASPATHDLPWQDALLPEPDYPAGTTVAAQVLADVLSWLAATLP